jgi:Undecaprenyl-phosphate glucose phosphotransferase
MSLLTFSENAREAEAVTDSGRRPHVATVPSWFVVPVLIATEALSVVLTFTVAAGLSSLLPFVFHPTLLDAVRIGGAVAIVYLMIERVGYVRAAGFPATELNRFSYVLKQWMLSCFAFLLIIFFLKKADEVPRFYACLAAGCCLISLYATRLSVHRVVSILIARGRIRPQSVILIAESPAASLVDNEAHLQSHGFKIALKATLPARRGSLNQQRETFARLIDKIQSTVENEDVREIVIVGSVDDVQKLDELLAALRAIPLGVRFFPNTNVSKYIAGGATAIGSRRLFELQRAPLTLMERALKRFVDIFGACAALILLAPFLLIVAAMIKLDSDGPVIFRQTRIGFGGRPFKILKFRSMRVIEDGEVLHQATHGDQRVTRIGRWMRANSVDELPQLFNVLRGEMSLIGPRPHARAHHKLYRSSVTSYAFRHHVRPGMTGWAQANGYRGETPTLDLMSKRVEHDLWYIRHWSFWLDIKTAVLTLRTLLSSSNAY